MHIGILAPIATSDLLPDLAGQPGGSWPKGRAEAPLISHLIHEYLRRGHTVLAVTTDSQMADDDPPFVYRQDRLTYVVVPMRQRTFRPNGKRPGRTADFFRFERRQLLAVLRQYRPEVVHAHWTYEFAVAALAYTPDAVVTVHDNAQTIYRYVRTLERLFMLLMARYVFRKGRWFTAVSPYMAESVQPWTSAPVTVVPNPVLPPLAHEPLATPDVPIVSMVVNGWDPRKNSPKALLAFKQLQQRHPDAVLWGFGTAFTADGHAAAFCREHQIPNVRLFGLTPHAEVMRHVAVSTLVLHASLEESFGMVPAEAMNYGVPVVAGKHSGAVPWVVADGGLLVDVADVTAMTDAMDQLLTDPLLYDRLSTNAARIVKQRFPIDAVADQYANLYRRANPRLKPAEQRLPGHLLS